LPGIDHRAVAVNDAGHHGAQPSLTSTTSPPGSTSTRPSSGRAVRPPRLPRRRRGAAIAPAVDLDEAPVGAGLVVAPPERGLDRRRRRIVEPHADVERVVVEQAEPRRR
jgi:hypothetical protein